VTLGRRSDCLSEIATDPNPLARRNKKFKLFVDESITPFPFVTSAASSGIQSSRDALPIWQMRYGKRFGSSLADEARVRNTCFSDVPASLDDQRDPRYLRDMRGGASIAWHMR